jgi:putative acetyltransferase
MSTLLPQDPTPRITVRPFAHRDASALALIFHRSVREVGRRGYTQAQVEAWSPAPVPAEVFLSRVTDGRKVFVAVNGDDTPLGFIELEANGHIDRFYCRPDVVGTGVGSALYGCLERAALDMGLSLLLVEASEVARDFFLRRGFRLIRRQDFERNGIAIHNYVMDKSLR